MESNLTDIKAMIAGIYERFDDLEDKAEAIYKTVTYEPNNGRYPPNDDFDFLGEED